MVLERRLDYRIRSYHFPLFPPVPIAAKGKRSVRKRNVENHMCPFDLLAAVAGKLLQRENSSANYDVPRSSASESINTKGNVKQELFHEKKPCNDEFPISHTKASTVAWNGNILSQDYYSQKEHSQCLKLSRSSSSSHSSDTSNKDIICDTGSPFSGKSGIDKIIAGKGSEAPHSIEEAVMVRNHSGCYKLDESVKSDAKPPLIRSGSIIEVPLSRDNDPCSSFFPHSQNGLELVVDRDDDENSSVCTDPCTATCSVAKSQFGEPRITKLLASRYWKVLGTAKQAELSKTYPDMATAFCSRKISYRRQRTQITRFKRRNILNRYSVLASHKRFCRAGVMNLFQKDEILEGSNSSAALHEVNGVPSTITEQLSSYNSEEFHVKLSIKSFIVPELFIEIPETATVGSLKRTVMDAVTTIVESGLHVGVLLRGKNFKDDDRTLLQAGIPHANKLDELSFTLEPSSNLLPSTYSSPLKPHLFHPCDSTKPLTRPPVETSSDQGKCGSSSYTALTSTMICHERDLEAIRSPLNMPSLERTASCQAHFASPAISIEALPVVPRKAELVQRRIRRPFTVSEVEALVQAVEELGTGRWRDVKLRSFGNAKHRTYVDLKDKWKTLVHTAKISPQQRRGEPVPHELLDRVLCAHAYWSKQQAKLQAKLPSA